MAAITGLCTSQAGGETGEAENEPRSGLAKVSWPTDMSAPAQNALPAPVKTTARTGVEMEAMTGASATGLTIYDMTKSLGLGIEIQTVRLLSKTGGKSDFTSKND